MTTRDQRVADVAAYLQEQFPNARIEAKTDGLTANAVFTISDGADSRHVEVTKRWVEGNDAGLPLARAIREWNLADTVRRLPPSATLRVATTGVEQVG